LFDYDPMESWTKGRITLLGDAAHPLLPFLGAGASMAIEDAVLLSRAFAGKPPVAETLLRYERARLDRTSRMMLASRKQGETTEGDDADHYLTRTASFRDNSLYLYDPVQAAV
jgi:salicylate hydroxylase